MHKAEPYATPISESAPSERMARSGRESRYLYRAAGLTLYSIKTASELRSDAQGGALCHTDLGERAQRADGALRQREQVLVPSGRPHTLQYKDGFRAALGCTRRSLMPHRRTATRGGCRRQLA